MKGESLQKLAQKLGSSRRFEGRLREIVIDSRLAQPGDVFFALKGEKVDGHAFLREAASKRIAAAVVSADYRGEDFGIPLIFVQDVLQALQTLAKECMEKRAPKVIAVTGSVGKTTTKEFIASLLEAKYKVRKTPGNANSQTGIPLSILNTEADEEIFVMEMGMSAAQEIKRLVQIAPPEIAVITRIGLAHAEFFPEGVEAVAAAKMEILSHPRTRLGILNAQTLQFEAVRLAQTCPKIFFQANEVHSFPVDYRFKGNSLYSIEERGVTSPSFVLPFSASHLCENFLASAAVARNLGLSWEQIFEKAKRLCTYERRFERIERNGITFINDSYNANPESMRAALCNLPAHAPGKKTVAVIGEMKELGKFSESAHREIAEIALNHVDHLLCFGKESLPMVEVFSKAKRPAIFFQDFIALKQALFSMISPGDVVLIKGSNSNQLWRLME